MLLGLLVSCGGQEEPDFVLETERMSISGFGHSQDELCGGTARRIDDYVDALAPHYELPDGKIGQFYWYSEERWDQFDICGTAACAYGDTVFARSIPYEHEIVHVVQERVSQSCVFMLEEGLAGFLRGTYPENPTTPGEGGLEHLLEVTFDDADFGYNDFPISRHFVSFLVAEHGLDTIIELCAATPRGISREEFDAVSIDMLGQDLDQLLVGYAAYPDCTNAQDRARIFECGRTPAVVLGHGDQIDVEIAASCASEVAVGPLGDAFHVSFQVRILEDGDYSWGIDVPFESTADLTGVVMRLEQCAACADDPFVSEFVWQPGWLFLPEPLAAGDYLFELRVPLAFDDVIVAKFDGPP